MPSNFDFRGLHCTPVAGEERSWYYLPRQPDVRRDAMGAAQLTLVDTGVTAYLLFTATWAAPEEDLEALRQALVVRLGEHGPERIRLSFAPLGDVRCAVLVGDGTGSFETIAGSATSGLPPYDAVFNLVLTGSRTAAARGAAAGRTDLLALEFEANLGVPVAGSATLTASREKLRTLLLAGNGEGEPHQLLEEAVRLGLAAVTVDVPDPYVGLLATTLYDRVLAEAARALPNWLDHQAPGDLEVSVTLEEQVKEPVRALADIGSIVARASTRAAPGGLHAAD